MTAITPRLCALGYAPRGSERDHRCMPLIAYFREKAAQCRRLAANIAGDPTEEALLRLAEEFDAKAALYEAHKRAALAVDGVTPIEPPNPSAIRPSRKASS